MTRTKQIAPKSTVASNVAKAPRKKMVAKTHTKKISPIQGRLMRMQRYRPHYNIRAD